MTSVNPGQDRRPRGTVFYVTGAQRLVALEAQSTAERWTAPYDTGSDLYAPCVTAVEGVVAVRTGNRMSVFDPTSGARGWRLNTEGTARP